MTTEAIEAKAVAIQASEELVIKTQDLEESLLHNQTLECRLQAAMKEIEAAKASEVFAHTEVYFPFYNVFNIKNIYFCETLNS